MKTKKIPLRTCVVTHEKLEKNELLRVVRNKDMQVFVDDSLKANGRGCYLKKDAIVIEKAKKGKILDRVLEVNIDDTIYEELMKRI